uniref:BRCT domain-containing protein n=1 Tax=Coccidioides posadasii RMSCC 3488 TaxID=454284 RepID=A0A0J6FEL9_COCPO|nr:hypothetical protein CPAG_04008 [Coccidioides posadasii RMSCC 3488]
MGPHLINTFMYEVVPARTTGRNTFSANNPALGGRDEGLAIMSLAPETQDDSLDLTYLKEAALGISDEHCWAPPGAGGTTDAHGGLSAAAQKHGKLQIDVIVATEMVSNPQSPDPDGLPLFSYQQNADTDTSRLSSSHAEAWNAGPRFLPPTMTSTDSLPGDTQVVSQSVYDNILKQRKVEGELSIPDTSCGLANADGGITQKTLGEGDTGHLDLLVDLDEDLYSKFVEDGHTSGADDEPSSPTHYQPFPESQRFIGSSPRRIGAHDADARTPTPALKHNPFLAESKTPGSVMALSQLFNATQASSSPLANVPRPELSSDMPSPNFPVRSRQTATSLFSPLQTTSPASGSGCVEPQDVYISVKESQEARAKLVDQQESLSKSNYASDNLSDDGFFANDESLQRRLREKEAENELRKQFECVTAPSRPNSRKAPQKVAGTSLPKSSPHVRSESISLPVADKSADRAPQTGIGPESELETEQEDETIGSRDPNPSTVNGDDDKENVDNRPVRLSNPTALAHDALSQVLDVEEGLSTPRPNSTHLSEPLTYQSQPLSSLNRASAANESDDSHHEMVLNSQSSTGDAESTQLKPGSGRDDAESCDQPLDTIILGQNPMGSNPHTRSSPEPLATAVGGSLSPDKESMRPPAPVTEVLASFSSASKLRSPAGPVDCSEDVAIPESGVLGRSGQAEAHRDTINPKDDNMNEDTIMVSFVYDTPTPRPAETQCFQRTIPETSPDDQRMPSSTLLSDPSKSKDSHELPESDDLPAMSHINTQNVRDPGSAGWLRRNISNRLPSILSSPSGRQRRSMTDIASDQSPLRATPQIQFDDISLMTTDDKTFQEIISESDGHAAKKRKSNSGRGVYASSKLTLPRFHSHKSLYETASDPLDGPGSERIGGTGTLSSINSATLRTRKKTNPVSKSIWEVDDSPQRKVQGCVPHRNPPKIKKPSITKGLKGGKKGYSVAEAVVIYTQSSSSPVPTERISSDPPVREETPPQECADATANPSIKKFDFSNQIFAFFNGQPHGYYPATCVGVSNDVGRQRYLVLFEDSETPEELDMSSVKKLELNVNDTVKVFSLDLPKIPYRVVELTDKLAPNAPCTPGSPPPLTDIHGHASVVLAPKQEQKSLGRRQNVTVPISRIYLDKNLWSRLGVRPYSFISPSNLTSRLQTPMDCGETSFAPSAARTPHKETSGVGIFSGMAFAISYTHNGKELSRLERLILRNGGRILRDGFDELFHLPFSSSAADEKTHDLVLTSQAEQLGFVCLITDNYSRRPKYLQALALNLPCLSGRWVDHCISDNTIINWEPYLLAAGPSMALQKAVKSRILSPYPASTARLSHTIQRRPRPLTGQHVLIITNSRHSAERNPYAFFTYALGPNKVTHIPDVQGAIDLLSQDACSPTNREQDTLSDCVWIYAGDEESAKAARKLLLYTSGSAAPRPAGARGRGRPPKKRKKASDLGDDNEHHDIDEFRISGRKVRVLDHEYICQVLIFGNLFDGWAEIQQECHQ